MRYGPTSQDIFNVKDEGAVGDGVQDDTIPIATTRALANSRGGIVFYPPGIYITGSQPLYSNVQDIGSGPGVTILRLKNGANTDLFSGQAALINLSAPVNTGQQGTLSRFSLQRMTLDGNKANQTSGPSYPLRVYGYDFLLRDVESMNGYSGGILTDWNYGSGLPSPSDQMEAMLDTIKIHDCNGIGLQMGGPHDSRLQNILSFSNGSHNFHFAPNANGIMGVSCHGYLSPNTAGTCNWLIEIVSGCNFVNCASDGAFYTGIAILGNSCSWQGQIYTSGSPANSVGVQLGQSAGNTPFTGQILQSGGVTTAKQVSGTTLNVAVNGFVSASIKAVSEVNSHIIANIFQTSGSAISGTLSPSDDYFINVAGLTPDGTVAKSGGMQVVSSANHAFAVYDNAGNATFTVDSSSGGLSGFHVPGAIQITAPQGIGFGTSGNPNVGVVINPAADTHNGLVIFANSINQSVPLLIVQDQNFANTFTVDKNGNIYATAIGLNTTAQAGMALLIGTGADTKNGLVIYPNSVNQSVPLLVVQNSSFADVFHISKDGSARIQAAATLYSGSGAPSNSNGANGDYYFRTDTPGTANQRIYVKSAGAWVGIL